MPCRLTFKTTDNKEYVTIFKHGDDLRQDQLILQMITLMDKVHLRLVLKIRTSMWCSYYYLIAKYRQTNS